MVSEREILRRAAGIIGILTMIFGSTPPLMGTRPGLVVLTISAISCAILFIMTFTNQTIALVASALLFCIIYYIPSIFYCIAFNNYDYYNYNFNLHVFGLMAFLIWYGMVYLIFRELWRKKQ